MSFLPLLIFFVCFSARLPQHFGSTFGWLFMLSGLDAHCLSLPPACHTSLLTSQWGTGTKHKRCPDWPPTAPEVGRENAIKQGTSVRAGPCGPRTAAAWGHSHCAGPQCTAVGEARPPGPEYWNGRKSTVSKIKQEKEEKRGLYSLALNPHTHFTL